MTCIWDEAGQKLSKCPQLKSARIFKHRSATADAEETRRSCPKAAGLGFRLG